MQHLNAIFLYFYDSASIQQVLTHIYIICKFIIDFVDRLCSMQSTFNRTYTYTHMKMKVILYKLWNSSKNASHMCYNNYVYNTCSMHTMKIVSKTKKNKISHSNDIIIIIMNVKLNLNESKKNT